MGREKPRHHVPSWVIVSAVRYGLLRQSYIAEDTERLLRAEWDRLHPTDQQVIRGDLASELRMLVHIPAHRLDAIQNLYEWCCNNRGDRP